MSRDTVPGYQSDSVIASLVSSDTHSLEQDSAQNSRALTSDHNLAVDKIGKYAVGCGGHSDVWMANLTRNGHVTLIALKVLRCPGSDQADLVRRLEREVRHWEPLDHWNIAPFLGVHYESNGAPALMLPWYKNGSANIYLRDNSSADPIQIIKGIADGVWYLHGKGIVHGDLKAANVMVDDTGHAKIIDFGLARLIDSTGVTTSMTSSIRWCAPELLRLNYTSTTKASDVYAFASTALELLSGEVPYDTIPEACVPLEIMNGKTPPSLSSGFRYNLACAAELWRLLESCWAKPYLRPSIEDIQRCLQSLKP